MWFRSWDFRCEFSQPKQIAPSTALLVYGNAVSPCPGLRSPKSPSASHGTLPLLALHRAACPAGSPTAEGWWCCGIPPARGTAALPIPLPCRAPRDPGWVFAQSWGFCSTGGLLQEEEFLPWHFHSSGRNRRDWWLWAEQRQRGDPALLGFDKPRQPATTCSYNPSLPHMHKKH